MWMGIAGVEVKARLDYRTKSVPNVTRQKSFKKLKLANKLRNIPFLKYHECLLSRRQRGERSQILCVTDDDNHHVSIWVLGSEGWSAGRAAGCPTC